MDVTAAVTSRRAVKKFDPSHEMTEAEIEQLMTLSILSPTAFNIQNWRFVLVRDPELRGRIRAASWDQAQVTDASLLIVVCADLKAWDKDPERYFPAATPEKQKNLAGMIRQYYAGRDRVQMDEAMRSCGMAAMTIMLVAKEMGYDTCPMDGFDFEAVGNLIGLPDDHVISMFVAVGRGVQEPAPRTGRLDLDEVILRERFA